MFLKKIETHIKNTTKIFSLVSAVIGAAITLAGIYGFFYDEVKVVKTHGDEITIIKKDVNDIKQKIITKDIAESGSRAEFKALKEEVVDIKQTILRMDEKLDKVIFQTK